MFQLYQSCPELHQRTMSALKTTLSHGSPPVFVSLNSITPKVPAPTSSSCRLRAREGEGRQPGGAAVPAQPGTAASSLCPSTLPMEGTTLSPGTPASRGSAQPFGQLVPTKVILKQECSQQNVMFRRKGICKYLKVKNATLLRLQDKSLHFSLFFLNCYI